MLGLVRIASACPYTFVVLALFIPVVGLLRVLRTSADTFPNIGVGGLRFAGAKLLFAPVVFGAAHDRAQHVTDLNSIAGLPHVA